MIGQTISHYRILSKLGEGGMGVVYKAEDLKLGRCVALKFLTSTIGDDKSRQRFVHEAKAASSLEHPNICGIYEIDETPEGQMFIVMPCYEGESLAATIERGPLKLDEAIDIAIQVASGLSKAQEKGIVHRDIKPGNIFLTSDGLAKIVDFGLAKLSGRTKLTRTGTAPGTVSYMSPEQLKGGDIDHRSDIWALGVVLYEMITGETPFRGDYEQAMGYSIMNEAPKPVRGLRPDVPAEVERVIEKTLSKDPNERYQKATELIGALQSLKKRFESRTVDTGHSDEKSIPSIAVLPFTDMSPGRDQEYFCEGIAEELINGLTQIEGLRVAARTSAFQFKGKDLDIRRIGKELGVESVLEGSVRKAANRIRITAQLVKVSDGYHLWSEKYDRDLEDIFAIQDEISLAIVEKLRGKLIKEEKSKLVRRYTDNEEAYNLYLKGRYYWNRRHEGGIQKAIEFFQQAVEKDPLCAPAHVGIADCYNVSGILGLMDPRIAYARSREAVTKALDIDDDLAEAHASLGWIKTFYDWDWAGAEAEFLRTFELNPNYAAGHYFYSLHLGVRGRHDESIAEASRAVELDPIHLVFNTIQAVTLYWGRRFDAAIEQFRKTLDMDPNFFLANLYFGMALAMKEKWGEAVEPITRALAVSPGSPLAMGLIGHVLAASGRTKEALEVLDRLEELSKERFVGSHGKALIHLGLEADDRMFECLEMALVERESWLTMLNTLPLYDRVRSDPRFIALVRRVGFQR